MEVRGKLHAPGRFISGERAPVSIGYDGGWAPEPVGMWWRREKSLFLPGARGSYLWNLRFNNSKFWY